MNVRGLYAAAISLTLLLAACSTDNQPSGGGGDQQPSANGPDGFDGSLVTSGLYSATWTASSEAPPDVFNSVSHVTLTSDHQTFGNVRVQPDGSIVFGSGASELSGNGSYDGTGVEVTMDHTNVYVCAFTVDTDLTGSTDGATLHMKGTMSVRYHPEGIGDVACP